MEKGWRVLNVGSDLAKDLYDLGCLVMINETGTKPRIDIVQLTAV